MKASPRPAIEHAPSAFTLVECLVVVGIIAVLASLVVGIQGPVTRKAKEAKCLSNLRQIGIGLITYAGENNGILPTVAANNPPGTPQWFDLIKDYVGGADPYNPNGVLACPLIKPSKGYVTGNYDTFGGSYWRTYAPSTFLNHMNWNYRLNNCPKPAGTILAGAMQPAGWNQLATADGYLVGNDREYTWNVGTNTGAPRVYVDAKGYSFVVFADGHASMIAANQLNQDSPYWKWW